MAQFRTSTFKTKFSSGARSEVRVSNYYNLIKVLRETDKELLAEFRKKAKDIGKPVRDSIKTAIKPTPPLSGMRGRIVPGRTAWGVGKPAKSALIRLRNPRRFQKAKRLSLLSIVVGSPGTVIADMAGKTNSFTNKKPLTPVYAYSRAKGGFRLHRINGQGKEMIKKLNLRLNNKGASRIIWPAAEKALPDAREQFQIAVDDVVDTINKNLERVDGI